MLVELGLVEQRYRAVLEVLDDGATVVDVARRYGVARQTVHNLLNACSVTPPPSVNAGTHQVSAGALCTRRALLADGELPRGDAVRPGPVAQPERLDPLVQRHQPL